MAAAKAAAAAAAAATALLHFTAVQCLLACFTSSSQAMVGRTEGGKAVSTFLAVAVPSPKYHSLGPLLALHSLAELPMPKESQLTIATAMGLLLSKCCCYFYFCFCLLAS